MNAINYDFHLFDQYPTPTPTQWTYTPSNPNWTGQANGVGTYTADTDLSAEMKTFYDKNLIRLAEPQLVHDQFGQKRPIPGGNGKTIEFRKFNALPAVPADRELIEGITPTGQNYGVTAITATVRQYGGYITLTDMLNLTAYDSNMQELMKMLASQAGRVSDTITRDILQTGTNVMYAGGRASQAALTATDYLKIEDIKKAVRWFRRNNAETINGDYVAVVHPDVVYDLQNDTEWVDANEYAGSARIFSGEVGKMYGVRFVQSTQAKVFLRASDSLPLYGTLVFAANAFGVTSINGGGIETIVKQLGSGGTSDPLNQRSTVGWKLNKTAKILTQEYMIRIESAASYGSAAVAN